MVVDIASQASASALSPEQFVDVQRSRSAVRSYTAEPISDETVRTLVTAMLAAPSGGNKQAWSFVVVRDPGNLRRVRAFAPGVIGAPTLLLVACADNLRGKDDPIVRRVGKMCVAMAVQNFLLAAHAHGLGGCPISSFRTAPLALLLDLPPHVEPALLVPVGRPAREPERSIRLPQEEVVSYEAFGQGTPPTTP
ncbi:nitroreductase family protein [Streptomyces sp. AJS327]|uniref:nitroreductase family protein n=1 Tax=Streptomyces sp. AJS327 TaxID=2545265 RepID=UPI0027E52C04|nr:nitroreductase family protein [Streptomyces sp. AJS327]